jgi:hypothetical protein
MGAGSGYHWYGCAEYQELLSARLDGEDELVAAARSMRT